MDNIIQTLTTVPASDVNYKSALENATSEQIRDSVMWMDQDMKLHGGKHKGRIAACMGEVKRRRKFKS